MQKTLNITLNGNPSTIVVNVQEIADLIAAANAPQDPPPAPEYLMPSPTVTTGTPGVAVLPFSVTWAVNSEAACIGVETETESGAPIGEFWSMDRSGIYNNQTPTGHGRARLFECASDGQSRGKYSEWVNF